MIRLVLVAAVSIFAAAAEAAQVQYYQLPTDAYPHDVAPAPDGTVWFTGQREGFLGRFDPRSGKLEKIPLGPSAAPHGVIAAYGTHRDRPDLPFWPMLFANLTVRLLGSDDFPAAAKHRAAADLTAAARDGALRIPIDEPSPLDRIAAAHDRVDAGARKRVVLSIPH